MCLVRLNISVNVAINGIFSIKWGYYGLKDIFWTIGSYSYFCITPSYIPSRNKCYRGWNNGYINIPLTQCYPYKIESQYILWYLLCGLDTLVGDVCCWIMTHHWDIYYKSNHKLNCLQLIVSGIYYGYRHPISCITKSHPLWGSYHFSDTLHIENTIIYVCLPPTSLSLFYFLVFLLIH